MNVKNTVKSAAALLSPILLFPVLRTPYLWLNSNVIVDWLGCGCPQIDENGNIYEPIFNANDFTACFWLLITVTASILSIFVSRKFIKDRPWLRTIYVVCTIALSIIIARSLYRSMLWN